MQQLTLPYFPDLAGIEGGTLWSPKRNILSKVAVFRISKKNIVCPTSRAIIHCSYFEHLSILLCQQLVPRCSVFTLRVLWNKKRIKWFKLMQKYSKIWWFSLASKELLFIFVSMSFLVFSSIEKKLEVRYQRWRYEKTTATQLILGLAWATWIWFQEDAIIHKVWGILSISSSTILNKDTFFLKKAF